MRTLQHCLFVLAFAASACSTQGATTDAVLDAEARAALNHAASAITGAERIRADLAYLADDRRAGREAGTAGYLDAAGYVAARLGQLGVAPGVDGDWFQNVPLRTAKRDLAAAKLEIVAPDGKKTPLVHLDEFYVGVLMNERVFDVTAPVAFVGYGVTNSSTGYDDYANVDANGKIVIAFRGGPRTIASEIRAHVSSTEQKLRNAAAHGAVAVIFLQTESSEARSPWSRLIARPDRTSMTWVAPDGVPDVAAPSIKAIATMSTKGGARLFEDAPVSYEKLRSLEAGEDTALEAFDLPGELRLAGAMSFGEANSPNVVGLIEGSDPQLKDEVVALSAHLDHTGVSKQRAPEDAIYNGALDNAMGVAILIEVAERLEEAPPRRSVLLLAVTAEEKGLLGSDYFARFPTIGSKRIVANVNLDMPLPFHSFSDVIAFGAERSTLGDIASAAAKDFGISLTPDPMPERNIFVRSDHYRFVEQGVPSIYLFLGFADGGGEAFADFMRNHYHQPSDDLSLPIDFKQAERFAELNYLIARAIADADEAPRWNEGDFFGDLFGN